MLINEFEFKICLNTFRPKKPNFFLRFFKNQFFWHLPGKAGISKKKPWFNHQILISDYTVRLKVAQASQNFWLHPCVSHTIPLIGFLPAGYEWVPIVIPTQGCSFVLSSLLFFFLFNIFIFLNIINLYIQKTNFINSTCIWKILMQCKIFVCVIFKKKSWHLKNIHAFLFFIQCKENVRLIYKK